MKMILRVVFHREWVGFVHRRSGGYLRLVAKIVVYVAVLRKMLRRVGLLVE
jgi:hypothetical protein